MNSIPLDQETVAGLIPLVMSELQSKDYVSPGEAFKYFETDMNSNLAFPFQVVLKRIEVAGLNVKFTKETFITFGIFPDRVGAVVVMLIDILEKLGETDISLSDIMEKVYPSGFYSEEGLYERIEELKLDQILPLNERKNKYSFLY